MKTRDSKLVRMLIKKLDLCDSGKKLVRRVYQGKTLQQAWKTASTGHLATLLQRFEVPPAVKCGMSCNCYWAMKNMPERVFRSHFKVIPAVVQRAYARA